MHVTTRGRLKVISRRLIAWQPHMPSRTGTQSKREDIEHARSTWRFFMNGAVAGRLAGDRARAARCLDCAGRWRLMLAYLLADAGRRLRLTYLLADTRK